MLLARDPAPYLFDQLATKSHWVPRLKHTRDDERLISVKNKAMYNISYYSGSEISISHMPCHASMLLAGIQPRCQLKACWHDIILDLWISRNCYNRVKSVCERYFTKTRKCFYEFTRTLLSCRWICKIFFT
jgi:hypothetical protein